MDPAPRQNSYPFQPQRRTFKVFLAEVNGRAHADPENAPLHLLRCQLECVRIFTWSIVQQIQDDHKTGWCRNRIRMNDITLVRNMGFLTSQRVIYSHRLAKRNYIALAVLLDQFSSPVMPYCWSHFLDLLRTNPVQNAELIARHFAILSDGRRLAFCSNIVLLPRTMNRSYHEVFFEALDSVNVDDNLGTTMTSNVKQMQKKYHKKAIDFCSSKFQEGTISHKHAPKIRFAQVDPPLRCFWLVRVIRNMLTHVGIGKRTPASFESKQFKEWLASFPKVKQEEVEGMVKSLCTRNVPASYTRVDLMSLILEKIPRFYVDIQVKLQENDLLKIFCINPTDRFCFEVYGKELHGDELDGDELDGDELHGDELDGDELHGDGH